MPETKILNLTLYADCFVMLSFSLTMIMFLLLSYPSLSKRLLRKIQISQNKCIRYCLKLDNRSHVSVVEFKKLNWLSTKERVCQCICVNIFKFFNDMLPEYTSEVFRPSYCRHSTRVSTLMLMLDVPFPKYCSSQKLYPTSDQELGIHYQLK